MMRLVFIFLMWTLMIFISSQARAAGDRALENVFKDSYYGAAIGGLLGAAAMVFTDRPADHFNYIAYGLAGGVIAGTVYGLNYEAKSLTEFEGGKVVLSLPRPEIKLGPQVDPLERKKRFVYFSILRYHF